MHWLAPPQQNRRRQGHVLKIDFKLQLVLILDLFETVPKSKLLLDPSSYEILIYCNLNWRNEDTRDWDSLVEVNEKYIPYLYLTLSDMKPFSVTIDIDICLLFTVIFLGKEGEGPPLHKDLDK